MKFLCIGCDEVMGFVERQLPGDGTLAAVFSCKTCGREMAMLTNPMETQLVSSMGVKIGGREVRAQPLEATRSGLEGGRREAFREAEPPARRRPPPVEWSPEAVERLGSGAGLRAGHGQADLYRLCTGAGDPDPHP